MDHDNFMMKAPFTTNSKYFKKPTVKNIGEAMAHIKKVMKEMEEDHSFSVPYIMLQERVLKNKEAKLVFHNKQFHHFLPASSSIQCSFPGKSQLEVIAFATEALNSIAYREDFITDGLVRVDIFQNNEGN